MIGSSVAPMQTAQHGLPNCFSPSRSPRRRDDDGPGRAVKMKEAPADDREELLTSDFFGNIVRGAGHVPKMVRTDGAKVVM